MSTNLTKPESITKWTISSNQKGVRDVDNSGVAVVTAKQRISQKFKKPLKAMTVKEIIETYM